MLEMPENLVINNGHSGDESPGLRKKVYQIRHSSISTFREDKQNAEGVYKMLFDHKKRLITDQGHALCEQYGIDPDSIIPRKIEYFES